MRPGRSGDELFQLVSRYAALGHHRTGSPVDHATAEWMADRLRECGLRVRAERVAFTGWECDPTLRIGDDIVECLGVPYEWQGAIDTTNVAIIDLAQGLGGDSSVLAEPVQAAKRAGFEGAVCATQHLDGALVGINRDLRDAPLDFPVFLVAGAELAELRSSVVRVTASARCVPTFTINLTADNGANNTVPGARLMLTTPLTGWFTCAGERGTGISVLLDLVTRFVDDRELLVVVTGGHELGFFGAREWVSTREQAGFDFSAAISAVLHIGASVAVETVGPVGAKGRDLIAQRIALTSVASENCAPIRGALAPIGLSLTTSPSRWVGEGEIWQHLGPPLLSTTGAGLDFHTPNDHADRVTSPAALSRVADAFADAVVALDDPMRA